MPTKWPADCPGWLCDPTAEVVLNDDWWNRVIRVVLNGLPAQNCPSAPPPNFLGGVNNDISEINGLNLDCSFCSATWTDSYNVPGWESYLNWCPTQVDYRGYMLYCRDLESDSDVNANYQRSVKTIVMMYNTAYYDLLLSAGIQLFGTPMVSVRTTISRIGVALGLGDAEVTILAFYFRQTNSWSFKTQGCFPEANFSATSIGFTATTRTLLTMPDRPTNCAWVIR